TRGLYRDVRCCSPGCIMEPTYATGSPATNGASSQDGWIVSILRLRPPRHPRSLPRMRYNSRQAKRMKRLRRIIFNTLTTLALLLCVASVTLWVLDRTHSSAFSCLGARHAAGVVSERTHIVVWHDSANGNAGSAGSDSVGWRWSACQRSRAASPVWG